MVLDQQNSFIHDPLPQFVYDSYNEFILSSYEKLFAKLVSKLKFCELTLNIPGNINEEEFKINIYSILCSKCLLN